MPLVRNAASACSNAQALTTPCVSGLLKTYDVACIADPEILCAHVDRRSLPCRAALRPRGLAKLLANFHSGQADVTLLSLPSNAPAVVAEPNAKRLRLLSYMDAAKAGGGGATAPGAAPLTMLAVHTSEEIVSAYTHRGEAEAEATVNLKDLKVWDTQGGTHLAGC